MSSYAIVNVGNHPELSYVAEELATRSKDYRYFTASAIGADNWMVRTAVGAAGGLQQRVLPTGITDHHVVRAGVPLEAARLMTRKTLPRLSHHLIALRNRVFERSLSHSLFLSQSDFVVGQHTCSLQAFEKAKVRGAFTALNYSTIHHDILAEYLKESVRLNGRWRTTLAREDAVIQNPMRSDKEIALADLVIVATEFVKQSFVLAGISPDKIVVAPYGVGKFWTRERYVAPYNVRPRVLFVGQMTQRKGIAELVAAMRSKSLQGCDLVLIGGHVGESAKLLLDVPNVSVLGNVTQSLVRSEMSQANVFVLPSYAEGMALSAIQAVAHRLPVVVSTRVFGRDLFDDTSIWTVEPGDVDKLTDRLTEALDNPELAMEKATRAGMIADSLTPSRFAGQVLRALDEYNF